MNNCLRMLLAKKILERTQSPREALQFLIESNNKYALDRRNPNSYIGICWVLGRYAAYGVGASDLWHDALR